jgi:hypothetical protein
MMHVACLSRPKNSARRTVLTIMLLLVGVSAVGIAATQAGRDMVRWVFTPVHQEFMFTHESTTTKKNEGLTSTWTKKTWTGNSDHPLTTEEKESMKAKHAEIDRIQQEGGGRLVSLVETPNPMGAGYMNVYLVEYTLSDGSTEMVGQGIVDPRQKANLRVEELLALRDTGAGEIISQQPGPLGLGNFVIRFTFSDGQTIDLKTYYPPGTREDREKIFAETRELKKQLRFAVQDPHGPGSDGNVWGILHYTLADGRTVGMSESVPKEALTPDGKNVAVPQSEASKDGWRNLTAEQALHMPGQSLETRRTAAVLRGMSPQEAIRQTSGETDRAAPAGGAAAASAPAAPAPATGAPKPSSADQKAVADLTAGSGGTGSQDAGAKTGQQLLDYLLGGGG